MASTQPSFSAVANVADAAQFVSIGDQLVPVAEGSAPHPPVFEGELPPYTASDDPKLGLRCWVNGCAKKELMHSWKEIFDHWRRIHNGKQAALKGTFLYEQALLETRKADRKRYRTRLGLKVSSDEEQPNVRKITKIKRDDAEPGPENRKTPGSSTKGSLPMVWTPPREFCSDGYNVLAAKHHSLRLHPDGQAKVEEDGTIWRSVWVRCDTEGTPMVDPVHVEEQTPQETTVQHVVRSALRKSLPLSPKPVAVSPKAQTPEVPTPKESAFSPLRKSVEQLTQVLGSSAAHGLKRASKKRSVEEPVPELHVDALALAWTLPEGDESVRRRQWPLPSRSDLKFDDFHNYLTSVKNLDASSADGYCQKMQYFYGLVTIENEDEYISHIGFFAGLYTTGVMRQLMKLPILSSQLPSTRTIMMAVSHYVDFLELLCGQQKLKTAWSTIKQLKVEFLDPAKKRANQEKETFSDRKNELDAVLLEKLAPPATMQQAVFESMLDLHTLWLQNRKRDHAEWQVKFAVNVIAMGIIYLNSYAGRPGEWSKLLRKKVEDFIESGEHTLVITKHKTRKSSGKLGRYVPDGNVEAMRKVLDIHPRTATYFLDPSRAGGGPVVAANLLKKWGTIYTPGFQVPKPTLMRKWFHTEEDTAKEQAFKDLCDMDGHSANTGKKFYIATKESKRAQIAESTFRKHVGTPVQWPNAEQVQEGLDRSEQRIASFWKKMVSRRSG